MHRVTFTSGDKHGWAIDEDLRQLRGALKGLARETSLARADVVHSPFWMALDQIAPAELARKFVIAHADNPPFFYVKQPEFALAQQWVKLWVARSQEAFAQFQALGLPVTYVPYAIDMEIFRPLAQTAEEKKSLRRTLGLPEDAFLIANFHRDSEGGNLLTPKTQKAPELLLGILQRLHQAGRKFVVLLAGPRRHWLRHELTRAGIPFHFVGQAVEGDDFGLNILDRPALNRLYAASDLYIVPSRWEGGPQSVMEAAACLCPVLSTPVGLAKDILAPDGLFRTIAEGTAAVERHMDEGNLNAHLDAQHEVAVRRHSASALAPYFQEIYRGLPVGAAGEKRVFSWTQTLHTLRRRMKPATSPSEVTILHQAGQDSDLDEIMANVERALAGRGVKIARTPASHRPVLCGVFPDRSAAPLKRLQFISSRATPIHPGAIVVAPAVQDIVNLRAAGVFQPAVTIPWTFAPAEGPLEVESGDRSASVSIWRALQAGEPVLYPTDSAYYEQIFHAGLAYAGAAEQETARPVFAAGTDDFRAVLFRPSLEASTKALLRLLAVIESVSVSVLPSRNPGGAKDRLGRGSDRESPLSGKFFNQDLTRAVSPTACSS